MLRDESLQGNKRIRLHGKGESMKNYGAGRRNGAVASGVFEMPLPLEWPWCRAETLRTLLIADSGVMIVHRSCRCERPTAEAMGWRAFGDSRLLIIRCTDRWQANNVDAPTRHQRVEETASPPRGPQAIEIRPY